MELVKHKQLKNISNWNIDGLKYQDLDNCFFHWSLTKYSDIFDKEGMKAIIGINSDGIDKLPSIFFSKGIEGVLILFDVWLKWRLDRLYNPRYKSKITSDNIDLYRRWINCYSSMEYLNDSEALEVLFNYQYNEMLNSEYFVLELDEGIHYDKNQIDIKKQKLIELNNIGRPYIEGNIQYGCYSDFSTPIMDKWNMQTIPGKNILLEQNRIKRVEVNCKMDVYSIIKYLYDLYKESKDELIRFDLLDKYILYVETVILNNDKDHVL